MNQFIALIAIYGASMGLGIAVMIYGWGLEPESWWWIIGGGCVGLVLIEMMKTAIKED